MAEKVLEEAVVITSWDTKMIESRIQSTEQPSSPEGSGIQNHYHNQKGRWRKVRGDPSLGERDGGWLHLARLSRAASMASICASPWKLGGFGRLGVSDH